jgi:hypothetical protein
MDLFDPKPQMEKRRGEDLPASIRRVSGSRRMTSGQKTFPVAPSMFKFAQHGQSGAWISELMPNISEDGRRTLLHPLHAHGGDQSRSGDHLLPNRLAARRPPEHRLVAQLRPRQRESRSAGLCGAHLVRHGPHATTSRSTTGCGAPASCPRIIRVCASAMSAIPCCISPNPAGVDRGMRRGMLDELAALEPPHDHQPFGDPEITTRIAQYEMAFRMQTSVPDLMDISKRSRSRCLDAYGPDVKTPGTYAANCLLARRLAERDVRFIQLFHMGWDHHGGLPNAIKGQCRDTDQPTAA